MRRHVLPDDSLPQPANWPPLCACPLRKLRPPGPKPDLKPFALPLMLEPETMFNVRVVRLKLPNTVTVIPELIVKSLTVAATFVTSQLQIAETHAD